MLKAADDALLRAKAEGRDRAVSAMQFLALGQSPTRCGNGYFAPIDPVGEMAARWVSCFRGSLQA